jgi:hypothetical protein
MKPDTLPFLEQTPLKVLHKAFESWYEVPYDWREDEALASSVWALPGTMYALGQSFQVEAAYKIAVKADNASVPHHLWDDRIWRGVYHNKSLRRRFRRRFDKRCPLGSMRSWFLSLWVRLVWRSLRHYLLDQHGSDWLHSVAPEAHQDMAKGRDCLKYAAGSDWWEWRAGSSLFFWRWTPEFRWMTRDGHPVWILEEALPCYRKPQKGEADSAVHAQIKSKLSSVLAKGYISSGPVQSLTSFFAMPKGEANIRMVFDASKSGLNKAIWAPSFASQRAKTYHLGRFAD